LGHEALGTVPKCHPLEDGPEADIVTQDGQQIYARASHLNYIILVK